MSDVNKITALKAQKNQKRVNIFLDGVFAFGLDLENVYKHKLKLGLQLTKDQVEIIVRDGEYQQVLEKVIDYISHRQRSEQEVQNWFNKKQLGSVLKEKVIEKLKSLDLINDKKFVHWWIEQRTAYKPRGKLMLRAELQQKGVDKYLIDEALANVSLNEEKIRVLAQKKFLSLNKLPKLNQKKKLTDFLLRKGFFYAEIKPVIDDLINKH